MSDVHAQMIIDEIKTIADTMGANGFTPEAASRAKGTLKVFRKNLAEYKKHFSGGNDHIAKQLEPIADKLEKQAEKDSLDSYV